MTSLNEQLNNLSDKKKNWQNNIKYGLVAVIAVFLTFRFAIVKAPIEIPESFRPNTAAIYAPEKEISAFENVTIKAKAAYVFDVLKNQPLFELNADTQLPLASLTKIMTAVAAAEKLPQNAMINIPKEAVLQEGDDDLIVDEWWPAFDLIRMMLITSSNDAAFALSYEFENKLSQDFIKIMNDKAKELNLAQTYFLNSTGLDLSINSAGAYGSAKDIKNLILYALTNYSSLIEATRLSSLEINGREFKNTNTLINEGGLIAGKTGFSDLFISLLRTFTRSNIVSPLPQPIFKTSHLSPFCLAAKIFASTTLSM